MSEVRSKLRRRGAIVALLTAFAVLIAASAVAA